MAGGVESLVDVVGAKGHFFRKLSEPECPKGKTAVSLALSLHLPSLIPPSHPTPLSLGISPPNFPASCSDPQNG